MKQLLYRLVLSVILLMQAASVGAFPPEDEPEKGAYKRMGLLMHATRAFVKGVGEGTAPWAEYDGLMERSSAIQPLLTEAAWCGGFACDTKTRAHLGKEDYSTRVEGLHSYTMTMFGAFNTFMEELNKDHQGAQNYMAAITGDKLYKASGDYEVTLAGTYQEFMQMHIVFFGMKAGLLKAFLPAKPEAEA